MVSTGFVLVLSMNSDSYRYFHKPVDGALKSVLKQHLSWNEARLTFLSRFLVALLQVRTICLCDIATAFSGKAQAASKYKRLQRFFRLFEMDFKEIAVFLSRLLPTTELKWVLAMDRTNWKIGKININILVIGVAHMGIAFPLIWATLEKRGNSNTTERIQLIEKFINIFGVERIGALTADREFIGYEWFSWLITKGIPFRIRIKENFKVISSKGKKVAIKTLFRNLRIKESRILKGKRLICGVSLYIVGMKLPDGEFLIIVTGSDSENAISDYKKRWEIETFFGCLKSRGFNFEATHITDPERIMKLTALLAIAFSWCHITGESKHLAIPVTIKKHGRKAVSIFRYGLDTIRETIFNIPYNFRCFFNIILILERCLKGKPRNAFAYG